MQIPFYANLSAKHRKFFWIALAVVAVVVFILIVRQIKKKKAASGQAALPAAEPAAEAPVRKLPTDAFPLKMGSQGRRVEQLQQYLSKKRGATFPLYGIDGEWGSETEGQVKKYLGVTEVSEKLFKDLRMTDFAVKATA